MLFHVQLLVIHLRKNTKSHHTWLNMNDAAELECYKLGHMPRADVAWHYNNMAL